MKINNLIKVLLFPAILISLIAYGAEHASDGYVIGKLEFTGETGRDGIVVINSPEKKYLLTKGALLFVVRGNEQINLKIDDADGKFLRCTVNSKNGTILLKHGEDVYYSDTLNSGIKYSDAKKILSELIKLYEDFILKIESTEDPPVIAAAVNKFSSSLNIFIPEIKRINGKYPELEKFNLAPPEELKSEAAKLDVLESRLRDAFIKVKMFGTDENVRKAIDELQKVLLKMKAER